MGHGHWAPVTSMGIADGVNLDAFSRLRVSDPQNIFAAQCQYDAEPLLFETGATNTDTAGAHNASTRMVALVTAASAGTSFIQSYEYIPYQPGKSQLCLITGLLGAGVAGATVDVGMFDASNGIFLRQNGASGLQIIRRTKTSGSVVETAVEQASWNVDKMDGTGRSGITLNPATVFVLVIDGQFLGMGRVRIGFDIGGQIAYVHEFLNANLLTVPYMQTLSLPVQMLVTATTTAKTAYFKCGAVMSEGGFADDLGYIFSTAEQTVTAASGTDTHILGMRPFTTFNSITNRAMVIVNSIEILVTGANPVLWKMAIGSTFSAGPTWGGAAISAYTGVEQTTAVGTMATVGTVIASGYVAATNQVKTATSARFSQRYPITLDKAGAVRANGTLHLFVSGIGGVSACRAIFNYTEIR